MSEQQLFSDLYRWLQDTVREELRQYNPNLAKAIGVLKGASLPLSGPAPVGTTGTGYPASPHEHPFDDITGELSDAQHGDRAGGSLHALATSSAAGFQAAADKAKSDLYPAISGLTTGHVLTVTGPATVAFAAPTGGFTSPLTTRGDLLTRNATVHARLAVGAAGTFLRSDGTDPSWAALVAADVPSLDASKIATGVLPVARGGTGAATASANTLFTGPTTGSAAAPTFRALVADDVPSLDVAKIGSGTLPVVRGGTGAATLASNGVLLGAGTGAIAATVAGSANQVLRVPGAGGAPAFGALDLAQSAAVTGLLAPANGGTGVNNAGTLAVGANTTISGGGTLALGGFTLTAPATGTAALRASAATAGRVAFWSSATDLSHDAGMTWDNTAKRIVLPVIGPSSGVGGIDFSDGSTSYANFQAWNNTSNSLIFFNVNRYWDGTGWQAQNGRAAFAVQLSESQFTLYSFAAGSNALTLRLTLNNTGVLNLPTAGSVLQVASTQVVTARRTGWGAPTGTATRTAFATGSVTTAQLAERVKALIDDLTTHGLIGA